MNSRKVGTNMRVWVDFILTGFEAYNQIAVIALLFGALAFVKGKYNGNLVKAGLDQLMVLYLCCLAALVFLPMPGTSNTVGEAFRYQLIPFYWIYDIICKPSLASVEGVAFNVVMTVPFGMYLRYVKGYGSERVILFSFLLSLGIETMQLTGFLGQMPISYRLCDMDDLIANTMGGFLGYLAVRKAEHYVPELSSFDYIGAEFERTNKVNG